MNPRGRIGGVRRGVPRPGEFHGAAVILQVGFSPSGVVFLTHWGKNLRYVVSEVRGVAILLLLLLPGAADVPCRMIKAAAYGNGDGDGERLLRQRLTHRQRRDQRCRRDWQLWPPAAVVAIAAAAAEDFLVKPR